tara:strand:- start:221 stop:454 length:234 start_codon:yes stop_codon:yes gene_type:complete
MSNRLAPKTQTDYIFRAIDMNITNQKMITDLMSVVKKQDEHMKLMVVKLLELEKTVNSHKKIMARFQMTEGNNVKSK